MAEVGSIDLGREDELVPWSEWFRRAADSMQQLLSAWSDQESAEAEAAPRWVFRVALIDGRTFAITKVSTHISRGRCFLGENRWDIGPTQAQLRQNAGKIASVIQSSRPICDVITGYTLMGSGEDGLPTVLNVPPHMIASVEGVVLPQVPAPDTPDEKISKEPFGFARWASRQSEHEPELHEVEEPALAEGAD